MKKKHLSVLLIILSLCVFAGCGRNEIIVKSASGVEYTSYQEACAAEDFQAAHQFLAKMQSDIIEIAIGEDEVAEEYIFKKEAMFLMNLGDEMSKKRILYLLKERHSTNDDFAMLIDLAVLNDDEPFVKQLANLYTKGADTEAVKVTVDYLLKKDESNKEYVISLLKRLEDTKLICNAALKYKDADLLLSVADNLSINDTDIIEAIAESNNKKMSEMIIGTLTKSESVITKKPRMGEYKSLLYAEEEEHDKMCDEFSNSIIKYNNLCRNILGIAIKKGNKYLAQRVVSKFRPNIHNIKDRIGSDRVVEEDNEDINNAKSTFQEALRNGVFN